MYKLKLPFSNGDSIMIDTDKDDLLDRPVMQCYDKNIVIVLRLERHAWFLENNIQYELDYPAITEKIPNPYNYFIIFKNKEDAMRFKLTWMGIDV
jgi:hypothetical protein